ASRLRANLDDSDRKPGIADGVWHHGRTLGPGDGADPGCGGALPALAHPRIPADLDLSRTLAALATRGRSPRCGPPLSQPLHLRFAQPRRARGLELLRLERNLAQPGDCGSGPS